MSAVDISGLGLPQLSDDDKLDYGKYQGGQESTYRRPPVEGKYTFQAPANVRVIPSSKGEKDTLVITNSKDGKFLTFILDGAKITNSAAENNGQVAGRAWLNTKRNPYRMASGAADYLRSHGITSNPNTNEDYAKAAGNTAGRLFEATIQWEGRCSDCDETKSQLVGQDAFPKNEDGSTKAVVECKHCKKNIFARFVIKKFIAHVTKAAAASAAAV
jgi:hypothetical protein